MYSLGEVLIRAPNTHIYTALLRRNTLIFQMKQVRVIIRHIEWRCKTFASLHWRVLPDWTWGVFSNHVLSHKNHCNYWCNLIFEINGNLMHKMIDANRSDITFNPMFTVIGISACCDDQNLGCTPFLSWIYFVWISRYINLPMSCYQTLFLSGFFKSFSFLMCESLAGRFVQIYKN